MDYNIILECQQISHGFRDKSVLFDVNIRVIRGEIVALVGPSGCGKSTLLRAIIGTHPPQHGSVIIFSNNQPTLVRAPGRDRGIVYQQYSLFPFLTALENVAIGPMLDQTTIPFRLFRYFRWRKLRHQHLEESARLLEKIKLGDAMHLYPHEMSGGMRQRVAVAQALIMKPHILLLDEPFGALDEATREELQDMLLELYWENCTTKENGIDPPYTILIVTHELNEAIYVGDRVVALSQYWNWKKEGYETCPGATIVYDRVAPVTSPEEEIDYAVFKKQRDEIRRIAFDPTELQDRGAYNLFWSELAAGKGGGILT